MTSNNVSQSRPAQHTQNNYQPNSSSGSNCFYCNETGHRWVVCPYKIQDEKDGKIVQDGLRLRFSDGTGIPSEPGVLIRKTVEKYLPALVAALIFGAPELPQGDDEPDTGYNMPSYSNPKSSPLVAIQRREDVQKANAQALELERMRSRLATMETFVQSMLPQPTPELSEEDKLVQQMAKLLAQKAVGKKDF